MSTVNDVLREYSAGGMTVETANQKLRECGCIFKLVPHRHKIAPGEEGRFGLLDTGTGTMDKVEVRDGRLVDCDCGTMKALCFLGGKTYVVKGTLLVEE